LQQSGTQTDRINAGSSGYHMTIIQKILCAVSVATLLLASEFAHSQRSSELSADLPDTRTMAVQQKVDSLFDAGDFKRAFFIYRNELAPLGDKYAQYMVGYMLITGLGVDEDKITASAWYRLASERDTPEFVAVRDQLMRNMTDVEIRDSDAAYSSLRLDYCDLAVLLASIKRDFKELEVKTGSRIKSDSSAITILDTRSGRVRSATDYYGMVYGQLEHRLQLLIEMGEFEDIKADPAYLNMRQLERLVVERIKSED
jgi:hypothetical protein